ncbi:hypothetical protein FRB97_001435 [Tulasnella sp. 331]|nr:hypothetical protein FRB97_001435 [Tulasnella sp. 331]
MSPTRSQVKVPAASTPAASGVLKVCGRNIVDKDGKPVILRGAGLDSFIRDLDAIFLSSTGYPGHEHGMRKSLKKVLGEEKYDFFFDRFLEYFFAEEDAKFFASLGLNCIRIPVNYRHLEDDMNPGVYLERGFQWIDRVVNLCAAEGVYTIIDLHAAPGGQNPDWHCDSGTHIAKFWQHIEFQNRAVEIWKALAERYKGNTWVAGYNPLNEPALEEDDLLLDFYECVEKAIREIDPDHILYWDGNMFASDFSKFEHPLPNSVYACHDYSNFGFPNNPTYTGSPEQKGESTNVPLRVTSPSSKSLLKTFERKTAFQEKIQGPIWNGEFIGREGRIYVQTRPEFSLSIGEWGPVYANPDDGPNWKAVNEVRYHVLKDQLAIYNERKISWSIWLYKDIGFQGMVYASPDTAYITRLKPFLQKKKRLAADAWGADVSAIEGIFKPVEDWLNEEVPGIVHKYPPTWKARKHISRLIRNILLSEELYPEYAAYFEGLSFEELDEMAAGFKFQNCLQRQGLNDAIRPK